MTRWARWTGIVDDDAQLAPRLADQAAQEVQENRRIERALIDLKRNVPRLVRLEIIEYEKRLAGRRMTRVCPPGAKLRP